MLTQVRKDISSLLSCYIVLLLLLPVKVQNMSNRFGKFIHGGEFVPAINHWLENCLKINVLFPNLMASNLHSIERHKKYELKLRGMLIQISGKLCRCFQRRKIVCTSDACDQTYERHQRTILFQPKKVLFQFLLPDAHHLARHFMSVVFHELQSNLD